MNNGGDRLGYIVMPMDLTERQALIYLQLYKKCNFQDMTVKYTREQLANDITITEIKPLTVYKEVTNMIKKGYLEVIKKGGKGNPTVYRIVPFIEIKNGTIKEQQQNNKRTIKYSKIKGCNGDTEQQRNNNRTIKEHPIKEKEKENNIYIYIYRLNFY